MDIAHDTRTPAPKLIERCSWLLERMYDERQGVFSHSTRLVSGAYVNDFAGPGVMRYTVNTLAGLQRAGVAHRLSWNVSEMIERFETDHARVLPNIGDRGLWLATLARADHDGRKGAAAALLQQLDHPGRVEGLNSQEIAWALLGLIAECEAGGSDEIRDRADRLLRLVVDRYLTRKTGLPAYDLSKLRGRFTSFGGVAYVLMALAEYGRVFDDCTAWEMFRRGTASAISLQGEHGEWPWFIDTARAAPLDWYQVYSVHQDAMAMLFLLPAVDLGIMGARRAVEKSYRWMFGLNELGEPMIAEEPFFIYRSIRRRGRWERERRFARSMLLSAVGSSARVAPPSSLEINRECRSYHPGWMLHVWAGRTDFPEFTELSPGHTIR